MTARLILPLLALAIGCGVGFGLAQTRSLCVPSPAPVLSPAPMPTASSPAEAEEVVIEVRVKAPRNMGPVLARDASTMRRGQLVNTENPLDLAIEGDGFFQTTMPDGTLAYIRDGAFGLSATGSIVTAKGYMVSPTITVPQDATNVSVGSDGTVSVVQAGSPNRSLVLGQLVLARFANSGWLRPGPDGMLCESERSGCPIVAVPGQNGCGFVRQGFRERHADMPTRSLLELVSELGKEPGVGVKVVGR